MENIETLIQGSEKLTDIFGYWPDFHDAEILEIHFWRGNVDPDQGRYDFPVFSISVHLWEMTTEAEPKGFLTRRHHTVSKLRFFDVDHFQMEGFDHQNAILGLSIDRLERSEGPSPYFTVHMEPAHGIGALFECMRIEVESALACNEDGQLPVRRDG